jgi:hypothetical protein
MTKMIDIPSTFTDIADIADVADVADNANIVFTPSLRSGGLRSDGFHPQRFHHLPARWLRTRAPRGAAIAGRRRGL